MPLTQPFPLKSGPVHVLALLRKLANVGFAAATVVLLICGTAHAQGGVPLVTVATDQSSLNLSNQFGVPAGTAINQAGDFAFVGNGQSALFFRAVGASAATRLLQIEDEAPGFPGSKIQSFEPVVGLNAKRVLLFGITFQTADDRFHSALLIYDGTNYQTIVKTGDTAPGPSGGVFGLGIIPGSINDSGDTNFETVPNVPGATTFSYAFYIVPAGKPVVRIVGFGDSPPASCPWCVTSAGVISVGSSFLPGLPVPGSAIGPTVDAPNVPRLNAQGQMLINMWGALFLGAKDGSFVPVPMPLTGVCSPPSLSSGTGSSAAFAISGFLNNVGTVAYTNPSATGALGNAAICVAAAGGALPTAAITSGDPAPASLGGTIQWPTAAVLDDSGDIVFLSALSGQTNTTSALLRYRPTNSQPQLDVVAYDCEAAPGTNSFFLLPSPSLSLAFGCGPGAISAFSPALGGVSVAKDGTVSFRTALANGESAIYRQSGAAAPELVYLDTNQTDLLGSFGVSRISFDGFYPFPFGETKTLDNGSTFFFTYLTSGPADFAVYLGAPVPGTLQTLMSTADSLPAGAVSTLVRTPPKMAGHFVAFVAYPAGGRRNLLLADTTSGTITRVVSDNDPALLTVGGMGAHRLIAPNFFLNDSGQIAFETVATNVIVGLSVISFGSSPVNSAWENLIPECGTIYLWSPSGGLTKVAAAGDPVPGSSTTMFSCVELNSGPPSPLNHAGQVSFISPSPFGPVICTLVCIVPSSLFPNGVFLSSPGGTITKVAAANDTLAGQTQATSFIPGLPVPVNSAGEVAFGAQLGLASGPGSQAFFLQKADGTTSKIMANGDSIPNSSDTFGFPHFISGLSDHGNLAFTAATGAAADGLFFAPAGASIQTIARDGDPAPGGGTLSLDEHLSFNNPPPIGPTTITILDDFAAMNAESDIAFAAQITGGSADSGYFRALHNGSSMGSLQLVASQGQTAPGGGTFNTIPIPFSSRADFSLGPDGSLAFVDGITIAAVNGNTVSFGIREGIFVARPDGSLLKVAVSGDTPPGGGVLGLILLSPKSAAGDAGQFAFLGGIRDGSAREAIFVTQIPPGTASATVTVAPLQPTAVAQQPVMLTATVSSATGIPSGKVTFFANGVPLDPAATLSGGGGQAPQATLTTSSLAAGPNSIVAQYDGDSNFAAANSAALSTVVAGFAPPPAQLTFTPGQSLVIPLTLFASAGSTMSFMLTTSGLPANTTVSFDQNPVTPGPNGTTVQLTLRSLTGSNLPNQPQNGPMPLGGPGLAALLASLGAAASLLILRQLPRWRLVTGACLATFALALVISGCGVAGSSSSAPQSSGPPPGPAAFTVTGASGATTVSTVVYITVQ